MIVRVIMGTDPLLGLKFTAVNNLFQYTLNYFQARNYGSSVKEIAAAIVCQDTYQLQFIKLGQTFLPRKKLINLLFKFEFEDAKKMSTEEVVSKSIELLIEASKNLVLLKIKDFNVNEFVADLEDYFRQIFDKDENEYGTLFPQLDKDTIQYMKNKWIKFLKD